MNQWYIISEGRKRENKKTNVNIWNKVDHEWINNDNKITKMVIKYVDIFWLADVIKTPEQDLGYQNTHPTEGIYF